MEVTMEDVAMAIMDMEGGMEVTMEDGMEVTMVATMEGITMAHTAQPPALHHLLPHLLLQLVLPPAQVVLLHQLHQPLLLLLLPWTRLPTKLGWMLLMLHRMVTSVP